MCKYISHGHHSSRVTITDKLCFTGSNFCIFSSISGLNLSPSVVLCSKTLQDALASRPNIKPFEGSSKWSRGIAFWNFIYVCIAKKITYPSISLFHSSTNDKTKTGRRAICAWVETILVQRTWISQTAGSANLLCFWKEGAATSLENLL